MIDRPKTTDQSTMPKKNVAWRLATASLLLLSVTQAAVPAAIAAPALQTNQTLYLPSVTRYSDVSYQSPFGISMFDAVDDPRGLSAMQTAGADLIFTNFRWVDLEPTQDAVYDFSSMDAKIAAATAKSMQLVVLFDHSPSWATIDPNNPRGPLKSDMYDDMADAVGALASRYNGMNGFPRVDYWLFFGEPDGIYSWGNAPTQYADGLASASQAIKSANSLAKVMPGAVAYERFGDDEYSPGPFVRSFLPSVFARLNTKPGGASAYIDGVAFNDFGLTPQRWPTLRDKATSVRQIMAAAGIGHLPLVVTELSRSSQGGVAEISQAQNVIKQYSYGLAAGISQMHWFMVFDMLNVPPADLAANAFGLFRGTNLNSAKPAYTAYRVVAEQLDGARYQRDLGAPGTQGFVFIDGPEQVFVVWANSATTNVAFGQGCARTITRMNVATQISDGGVGDRDGTVNGQVSVQVASNEPLIVRACQ
ncbi:MAG TPA: hypothetical protein PK954_00590 [Anaerolineales bacterium]|nr:hypothetical protein [Anaerolineales bacterium]HRF46152.1 hypothetical protein [Anaerolineales bacterium]